MTVSFPSRLEQSEKVFLEPFRIDRAGRRYGVDQKLSLALKKSIVAFLPTERLHVFKLRQKFKELSAMQRIMHKLAETPAEKHLGPRVVKRHAEHADPVMKDRDNQSVIEITGKIENS